MRTTGVHRMQDKKTVTDEKRERRLFVCALCGTLSSTNSAKRLADDQGIDFSEGGKYDGKANSDAVRLTPPCPCGCDVFNSIHVDQYYVEYE